MTAWKPYLVCRRQHNALWVLGELYPGLISLLRALPKRFEQAGKDVLPPDCKRSHHIFGG